MILHHKMDYEKGTQREIEFNIGEAQWKEQILFQIHSQFSAVNGVLLFVLFVFIHDQN